MLNAKLLEPIDLEKICKIIADNDKDDGYGVINGKTLTHCFNKFHYKESELDSKISKWNRLYNCLTYFNDVNMIKNIIEYLLHPRIYNQYETLYNAKIEKLNAALIYLSLKINKSGKFEKLSHDAPKTISEAKNRLKKILEKVESLQMHKEIMKYCQEELLTENYFHLVLEASKSILERIRQETNLTDDGDKLINIAFWKESEYDHDKETSKKIEQNKKLGKEDENKTLKFNFIPYLGFSALQTLNEKNLHFGLVHAIKAIVCLFRNITAHEPKINPHPLYNMNEIEAIECLQMISYIHKKLDTIQKFRVN